MNRQTIFISLLICFIIILIYLFLRVSYLENRQKAFASLPQNVLQTPRGTLEKIDRSDYVQGNPNASVTLIEYSDFECPSCQRMHPIFQKLIHQYGKNIRFVQRMFPLPQNKNAEKEAEAVLCAGQIGGEKAYWNYGDSIFKQTKGTEGGEGFSLDRLVPLAKELGLNEKMLGTCLLNNTNAKTVQSQTVSGETAGVSQLPTLFILDKKNEITMIAGEQSLATLQVILSYAISE